MRITPEEFGHWLLALTAGGIALYCIISRWLGR